METLKATVSAPDATLASPGSTCNIELQTRYAELTTLDRRVNESSR